VTVFDINAQTDSGPKNLFQSVFAYLNRSAKRGSAASRALIDEWLFHFPESEQDEFCARIRSGDDIQFRTAFQELFLHVALLIRRASKSGRLPAKRCPISSVFSRRAAVHSAFPGKSQAPAAYCHP
jgi:hypothetical protein